MLAFFLLVAAAFSISSSGADPKSLGESLGFTSKKHVELYPEGPLSQEQGTILQGKKTLQGAWVYRGPKGKPATPLNIYIVRAGAVKTYADAKKLCAELAPAKTWQLASYTETIVYGAYLLTELPQTRDPKRKMYLYWAAPERSEKEDKTPVDTFVISADGDGGYPDTISYSEWYKEGQDALEKVSKPEDRKLVRQILDSTKDGVPVLCVAGTPEDSGN